MKTWIALAIGAALAVGITVPVMRSTAPQPTAQAASQPVASIELPAATPVPALPAAPVEPLQLLAEKTPVVEVGPPESVRGRIVQITNDGVLLECGFRHYANNKDQTDGFGLKEADGIILLAGHPDQQSLVDDQRLGVIAGRIGIHRYTSVSGAEKTVASYRFLKNAAEPESGAR